MRQLNHDLKRLLDDARDGAFGTRAGRSFSLARMANTLHELGYRRLRATGLKGKHVEALVREWQRQGLSIGTVKNRMSHLRWWARRIGKPNVVRPDNASYGIGERRRVTNEDRSRDLPDDRLALVRDAHVRMALRLQEAFGLRREEAIKFSPSYADRGSKIVLKASPRRGRSAAENPAGWPDEHVRHAGARDGRPVAAMARAGGRPRTGRSAADPVDTRPRRPGCRPGRLSLTPRRTAPHSCPHASAAETRHAGFAAEYNSPSQRGGVAPRSGRTGGTSTTFCVLMRNGPAPFGRRSRARARDALPRGSRARNRRRTEKDE